MLSSVDSCDLTISDGNFGHLAKVVPLWCLLLPYLCKSKYFVGRDSATVQISSFSSYLLSAGISFLEWFLPAIDITVVFARWWFPLSIFPSTVANVNAALERTLLSSLFIHLFTYLRLFRLLAICFMGCNSSPSWCCSDFPRVGPWQPLCAALSVLLTSPHHSFRAVFFYSTSYSRFTGSVPAPTLESAFAPCRRGRGSCLCPSFRYSHRARSVRCIVRSQRILSDEWRSEWVNGF